MRFLQTRSFVARHNQSNIAKGCRTPAIAPHAPYTVCDAHLQQVQALAERRSCPVVMHVAETRHERDECLRLHGSSPVEHLRGIGLLSERLIAAHMVWTDEGDLELLRRSRAPGLGSLT